MRFYSTLILFFIGFTLLGQSKNYTITYLKSSNGKTIESQDPIVILTSDKNTTITANSILKKQAKFPFEVVQIDRSTNFIYQIASLSANNSIATIDSVGLGKQHFTFSEETKKIAGYWCKKATIVINSNTIDLWYTNALSVKGAPTTLGQNLGLVLEMIRNGNYAITATKIEKSKEVTAIPIKKNQITDILNYRDLLWKSRFITIPVFENETINFSGESQSNDSIFRFANGTIILKRIQLPIIPNGSQIFIDLTEQSQGDAYDRTGSVFLIPKKSTKTTFFQGLQKGVGFLPLYENGNDKKYQGVVATKDYTPLVELMRFFTPFGIQQYNHIQLKDKVWEDKAYYRQDISDVTTPFSSQEVYVGVFIGNYDKGGHKISLNMTIHPEEEKKTAAKTTLPLFNTTNIMEMAGQEYATMFNTDKGLEVTFTLEQSLQKATLRYITTGHGGWENGDEFVPKKNSILIDGKEVFHFIPWRQDCGSYRLYNPASGNFPNGLSSSDYSRSNWCPGTVTTPIYIDLGSLAAGTHTLHIKIPQSAPEGGSFSAWNVSGVLIGE